MRPTLISFGFLEIHAYTAAMAIAVVTGVLLAVRANYRQDRPLPVTPVIGIWIFLGGLIGARIYWILQYDTVLHLYRAIFFWQGGLVFYGGLMGGGAGGVGYAKWNKVPVLPACDLAFVYLPLAHAIARIGCFLNGCCWGSPTNMPWGVRFPQNAFNGPYFHQMNAGLISNTSSQSLPVHPVQLYEAAGLFILFILLRALYTKSQTQGTIFALYFTLYGALRLFVESFRGDSARSLWGFFTASQAIGAILILFGLAFLLFSRLKLSQDAYHVVSPNRSESRE